MNSSEIFLKAHMGQETIDFGRDPRIPIQKILTTFVEIAKIRGTYARGIYP